jgi:beta-lactamase superfamily II metal-dependent hydrolase
MSKQKRAPDWVATLRFFYCGRGDTILVQVLPGGWGLIDCCLTKESGAYQNVRDFIEREKIRDLEFVCLTHPDLDHYHGMRELLQECFYDGETGKPRFRQFWDSGVNSRLLEAFAEYLNADLPRKKLRKLYQFIETAQQRGLDICHMISGRFVPVDFGDFLFGALAPKDSRVDRFNEQSAAQMRVAPRDSFDGPMVESNDLSAILVFMHKDLPVSILFGGDATTQVWKEALPTWNKLVEFTKRPDRCFQGVKVSHHGALGSLHPELYQSYCKGKDTIAILSVGPNDNKHPHPQVLDELKAQKIRVYATCWPTKKVALVKGSLPLAGSLGGTGNDRLPSDRYDRANIEVKISRDGRLSVTPKRSLLRLT